MFTEESESPSEVNKRHSRGSQENKEESSKVTPTQGLGGSQVWKVTMLEQRQDALRSGGSYWHLWRHTMSLGDQHKTYKEGKSRDIHREVGGQDT